MGKLYLEKEKDVNLKRFKQQISEKGTKTTTKIWKKYQWASEIQCLPKNSRLKFSYCLCICSSLFFVTSTILPHWWLLKPLHAYYHFGIRSKWTNASKGYLKKGKKRSDYGKKWFVFVRCPTVVSFGLYLHHHTHHNRHTHSHHNI